MSYGVDHNTTDISSHIISYKRIQRMCSGVGVAEIVIAPSYTSTIDPYDEFEIFEEGMSVGTYFVQSITRTEPEHTINILAQDVSKMLVDFFIDETYEILEPSSARYWIEYLLNRAGITYEFVTDEVGHDMSLNTSIGNESLIDRLQILCAENGWYFLANSKNTLIIGSIEVDYSNFDLAVMDSTIEEFSLSKNDKMLRNRVIVRGSANPYTKIWVYGEVKAITPWNYDTLDYRTTVITAPDMPNVTVASQLANQLFAETKKITEVKEVTLIGYYNVSVGNSVYINHSEYNGIGLVTSVGVETTTRGARTTLIVDERCPRMFGYYRGIGDVYIATRGSGVWRKPIKYSHVWENYSTGLANLNIFDLSIANGILGCVTDDGELYTSFPTESGWVRTYLPDAVDAEGSNYISSEMAVNSVSVDPMAGIVRAGINYTNPDSSASGIRSWVAEIDNEKNIEMIPVTYSGLVDIGIWDLETNDYATYIQGVRGTSSNELIVDPTKMGCLNNIATRELLAYIYVNSDIYTGQLHTTEYIDNNDITSLKLNYSNFNYFSIYAEMLYACGDNYLWRYDLLNETYSGNDLDLATYFDSTGYPSNDEAVFRIEAITRNKVCILYKKKISGKNLHIRYFDFTNTASITTTDNVFTVPDSTTKNYTIIAYGFINSDGQRVIFVHATQNVSTYKDHSYFMIYNIETETLVVDWTSLPTPVIQVPGSIANMPEWVKVWNTWNLGTETGYVETPYSDFNDIYTRGQLGQYNVVVYGSTRYYNSFTAAIDIYPYTKQVIYYTVARQVRTINVNTGEVTSVAFLPDEVVIDSIPSRPNEYGSVDIKINPNRTTTLRILCEYWKVTGVSTYTTVQTEFVIRNGNVSHTVFTTGEAVYKNYRATVLFTDNYNLFISPTVPSGQSWDTNQITDTDITTYKTVVSGYVTNDIDDYNGDLLNTHFTNITSNVAYAHIYNQDGEMILPNANLNGSPAVGGGYTTPRVHLLGGVLLWRDNQTSGNGQYNYVGFTTAVYSKNLINRNVLGIEYPILEYKPGSEMRLLGYSNSQYINASQTRPIVLYGGDQGFNNGQWDSFDPVDNSFSNIFVSGFVSDTTTMRFLGNEGLSTCILTCIQPPSGTEETQLWITDHDGILTSGNDYGGLVIVDGGIVYTDSWHTYTMSGWHTFSGIVTHVETSNYDDQPYVFVSTTVSGESHFFQLDAKKLEELPKTWTERSTNLPTTEITRIRVDERI